MQDVFRDSFVDQTTLHPIAAAALASLCLAMLVLPRRYAAWPLIMLASLIPQAQRVVVFSLDFNLVRVILIAAFVRLLARNELRGLMLTAFDWVLFGWAFVGTIAYVAQQGDLHALTFCLGKYLECIGLYFLFRALIREWNDVEICIKGFIVASIPVVLCLLMEKSTGRNLFAFLGGVPEFTMVREGRLRCQGPYPHPIMAGCYWASLVPLIAAGLWQETRSRLWAILGLTTASIAVLLSASSTPFMALVIGFVGACFFPLRRHMRIVRWALLIALISLHLLMNAPVWHLIARIDVAGGSTGWHRYLLIDQWINHFSDWWLVGTPSPEKWAHGLHDVTNQFVLEGVTSGFVGLILFIWLISIAFGLVGRTCRIVETDRAKRNLIWAFGVSLLIHVGNFIGVSYFGQIDVVWYFTLAAIVSLNVISTRAPVVTRRARRVITRRYVPAPLQTAS